MADDPKQPPKQGNGFWIGAACLVVGYLVGQTSTTSTVKPIYAEASPAAATPSQLAAPAPSEPPVTEPALDTNATATDETMTADYEPEDSDGDGSAGTASQYPAAEAAATVQTADAAGVHSDDQQGSLADASTPAAAGGTAATSAPWTVDQATNSAPASLAPSYASSSPSVGYSGVASKCEGIGCYGTISTVTGLPRTTYVHRYVRSNGTYVQPYYRSSRRH